MITTVAVVADETRTAQCPPGDRPGGQNEPDSLRAHGRNRRLPQVVVHPVCPS